MSLFSRYVCRYFVTYFAASLGVCTALFVVVEIFDRIDEFIERRVLWYDAARYLAFKLPGISTRWRPVGCLLASVLTFSTLNKNNEIVAISRRGPLAPEPRLAVGRGRRHRVPGDADGAGLPGAVLQPHRQPDLAHPRPPHQDGPRPGPVSARAHLVS